MLGQIIFPEQPFLFIRCQTAVVLTELITELPITVKGIKPQIDEAS